MNILIIGAGKVGYNLAKNLSKEHNVIVIDKNKKALNTINETLDVLTITGNAISLNTLKNLEKKIDFIVAVTNSDEVNLLSTIFLQDYVESKSTIVRVNNLDYIGINLKKFNIQRFIFPNQITATSIARLLEYPKANNIKTLPFINYILASVRVEKPIKTCCLNNEKNIIIGAERGGNFLFLNNEDEIKENDLVYILGDVFEIHTIIDKLKTTKSIFDNVLIFGANEISIAIAKILREFKLNIKILEKDEETATKVSEILGEIPIINSAYDDVEFLINEGLHHANVAIAASMKDEENIIKSIQAKNLGIKKIITINNNIAYYHIMHQLNLSTIRGPKIATIYEILEEIDSQKLVYEIFFLGSAGKIFIKRILKEKSVTPPENSKVILHRNENIEILSSKKELKIGDIVIEFNFTGNKEWIESL